MPRKKAEKPQTVWRLVKRGCAGVVSTVPNCGYTEEQLASLKKHGYRLKKEETKLEGI